MRLRPHTGLVAKALLFAVVFIGYGITIDVCWRFVGLPAWMGWIDPKSTDLINTEIVSSGNSNADISASNSLVKAFINICLQTSADLSKIETTAEQFKWQRTNEIEGEMLPVRPDDTIFKIWIVNNVAEVPFILGGYKESIDNTTTFTCKISNPEAPTLRVKNALIANMSLGEPDIHLNNKTSESNMWEKKYAGNDFLLTMSNHCCPA